MGVESNEENFDSRIENELKKIKLSLEHGADFGFDPSREVDPEMEGQFLDYIQQWEDQYAKRSLISVYDFIGRPVWKPLAEIADEDVLYELEHVNDLLAAHSVGLDTICEVSARELYRFITEELFNVEMNNIRIAGMQHCFIYEEFHPNHQYDIEKRCREIAEHITTERHGDMTPWGLATHVLYNGEFLGKDDLNRRMLAFKSLFESIELNEFSLVEMKFSELQTEATAVFKFAYRVRRQDNDKFIELCGTGIFRLNCSCCWWLIDCIDMDVKF